MHAMEIIEAVDLKARAIACGQGDWGENIIHEIRASFTFEKTPEEDEFLVRYVSWRQNNPLAPPQK
jgi:hypothetical protein